MSQQISKDQNIEALKVAASWPGADRATIVTLALEIITAGLARHPASRELAELRQQALYRLMERHQLQDPFRFLIYAEMAGVEIGPVAA